MIFKRCLAMFQTSSMLSLSLSLSLTFSLSYSRGTMQCWRQVDDVKYDGLHGMLSALTWYAILSHLSCTAIM